MTAHTLVKCKTVAGVSKDFVWTLRVAGQQSSPSVTTTFYKPPKITALRGPGAYNAGTEGGQKFYLEGDFFGPKNSCAGTESGRPIDHVCIDSVQFETTDSGPSVVRHTFLGLLQSQKFTDTHRMHIS